ncbi:hypothetical protein SCAR479_01600 [Seiridium cardinale]|uniref:Major facilitator superfamily (MFS) profile domain-containing protein n=1 Tax=Seiridium cardinale TaxID=138064 RepID=A0ABR2Y6Q1_9PEZI
MGMLVTGCFFAGVAVGMLASTIPMYASELSTPKWRGALSGLLQWFLSWGLLIAQWLVYGCSFSSTAFSCRFFLGFQIFPAPILVSGYMPYSVIQIQTSLMIIEISGALSIVYCTSGLWLLDKFGRVKPLIASAAGLDPALLFFYPETKGITLEQMDVLFGNQLVPYALEDPEGATAMKKDIETATHVEKNQEVDSMLDYVGDFWTSKETNLPAGAC